MTSPPERRRDWRALGCAALLGGLLAFPIGMMVSGGGEGDARRAARPSAERAARDVYSPDVLGDPYVKEQQLRVVEALERGCRELGQNCEEAKLARRKIEQGPD